MTEIIEHDGTFEERQKKDRIEIEKLFKDHLKLKDSDFKIQGTWRIGKEDPSRTKPRLLKVILDREYMIPTVLKATKNLLWSSDPTIKRTSIFKDMMREDRDSRRKLTTEMKARNDLLKPQYDPGGTL